MPLDQAAAALASALEAVPGIQRYSGMTLNELAQRGPRVARGLWAVARMRLAPEYGERTIGQLLSQARER